MDRTSNPKQEQLDTSRVDRASGYLTTQQGVRVDGSAARSGDSFGHAA
ncbi:catalase [Mycobacteroides abscessus subsp. abscessus]|nr:catalase [Mycobacteroides abscessus subsp. abscessus]